MNTQMSKATPSTRLQKAQELSFW